MNSRGIAPFTARNSAMTKSVTFVLPSFAPGGAQRVLLTLAARIDRTRFAPSLVVFNGEGAWRSLLAPDMPVTELGKARTRQALPALRRVLRGTAPDLVVSTMGYVNFGLLLLKPLLARRTRIIVREANTPGRDGTGALKRSASKLGYAWLYRRADRVISPSERLARELSEQYGVPKRLISVLQNPVDEAALRSAAAVPKRHAGPGRRFVAVGRLTRQKGYDRLLAAMTGRGDMHVTIFGDGEERKALVAQIAALGLSDRVTIAGFDPQPAAWLAGADALVLPSRWEGLPNVALEALACGTPVIATPESGGIAEIAARAAPGAVTIALMGEPFAQAMAAVQPRTEHALRPSLLPREFTLARIVEEFETILAATAAGGETAGMRIAQPAEKTGLDRT
jgi:glycosyltransferase involved in cell wall biosynthesis